jgi:transcription-repair coupling factor (superfamily II helicase)
MLKEIAEKRLQAIKEFTELGSGFKIAMRDLEIRGAGNLLGAQQSGHMESVGYDLYCKMLNDAVRSMKGEILEEETFDTTVDIDIDAFIPSTYIKSEFQKLDVYKRIAEIGNEEEFMDMQEELMDRFGDMPASVNNLVNIAYIKSICHSVYVISLVHKKDEVKLVMYNKAKLNVEKIPELIQKYQPNLKLTPETNPYFTYKLKKYGKNGKVDALTLFEDVKTLLNDMKLLLDELK